ncbi:MULTISPECIES: P-II family nitrogen regulator [Clostridium]|uniref:P-II family nitrogen regulator n=1 Tax=Clostridium cibarium TaxID=2762247 RepID=A0ABR8PQ53_9CLOT|nr:MULTISPECIES: P-II family nitrogen regulator [Clostridium]MBD7910306.1 P-II family nitrogen regulator [Clostridium cibarium]MDS0526898.1 P-II family nitrogen regulator [Clostridium sp. SHJSY1]
MYMIRAILRPEKVNIVLSELLDAGFPEVTKMSVFGRGKQKGIKVGDIHYDELPKEMLLLAVKDEDKDDVIRVIMKNSRTGEKGAFGDGKIFVSPIETAYTVSSGKEGL